MSVTERALRDVMGLFPTGVAVVTTRAVGGMLYGVTVNSFNSVSLEPPLVLFCLARNLYSLQAYLDAEAYAVNILREDQRGLSVRFGGPQLDKWTDIAYREGVTGSPVLHPTLAVLECRPHAHYDGGDHLIFVGEVVHLGEPTEDKPLAFFRGRYHRLNPGGQEDDAAEKPEPGR
ncbi:MAG: flavin reductase family protein [Bryobacteraceae bacterium]